MAVELNIFGTIGDNKGQTKDTVKEALNMAGGQDVIINISSSGGSVFEGLAIAGLISGYSGKTIAKGIGIVASAATLIMLSCKEKQMSKNSFFMLHNSWGGAEGNAEEMTKTIELLKKVDEQMAQIYVSQIESKGKLLEGSREKTLAKVKKMMSEETWLTADEALLYGFCDSVIEEEKQLTQLYEETFASIRAEANNFKNIPKQILSMTAEKKTFLQQMANWLGLNAEITTIEEPKAESTEAVETIEEPTPEVSQKTDNTEVEALENKLAELQKEIDEKQKKLESMEAEMQAKISYKAEPKAVTESEKIGFTQEQILEASKFINSLIQK